MAVGLGILPTQFTAALPTLPGPVVDNLLAGLGRVDLPAVAVVARLGSLMTALLALALMRLNCFTEPITRGGLRRIA
jgi:hypothetical protein